MVSDDDIENDALWEVELLLQQCSPPKSLADFAGMRVPHPPREREYVARVRQHELRLMGNQAALAAQVQEDLARCNAEQRRVFDTIVAAAESGPGEQKLFFLYASGGCGKTFLLNLILRYFRSMGQIASHAPVSVPAQYSGYFDGIVIHSGTGLRLCMEIMSIGFYIFFQRWPKCVLKSLIRQMAGEINVWFLVQAHSFGYLLTIVHGNHVNWFPHVFFDSCPNVR